MQGNCRYDENRSASCKAADAALPLIVLSFSTVCHAVEGAAHDGEGGIDFVGGDVERREPADDERACGDGEEAIVHEGFDYGEGGHAVGGFP